MIRGAQPRRFEQPPSSPCVKVCRISERSGYCIGCLRTRDEIGSWWGLSDEEKRELLEQIEERRIRRGDR